MTVKLLMLKSGEDIIADVEEMFIGEDNEKRIIGYYLNKACVVKLRNPNFKEGETKKGYEVSLFPWMPLSAEETIPIPSDWVVTMVDPAFKLKEMYTEDIVNYGKNNQSDSTDERSDSDNSN